MRAQIEDARDAIAAKEQEVAAATRRSRGALRRTASRPRRHASETMEALESREEALSDNLASISEQIASTTGAPGSGRPATPGAADRGRERRLHLRKPGQRAQRGPGRRLPPRSKRPTRSPRPLTSGAAATAPSNPPATTAPARQLRPARRRLARKPARLDRPRDLGRTWPRQVDHRLRQRRTRLDDHRRPRLRHRRRPRPPLALLAGRLARRLHRPSPPRLLTSFSPAASDPWSAVSTRLCGGRGRAIPIGVERLALFRRRPCGASKQTSHRKS